jgi:hypothetical protein
MSVGSTCQFPFPNSLAQKHETGAVPMERLFALFAALSLTMLQFAATVA